MAGLIRFNLLRSAFDVDLAGLAPFVDVWAPLADARRIADELGVLDALAGLLDWSTRRCWSVFDAEEDALLHKCAMPSVCGTDHRSWRLPPTELAEAAYSTDAMLAASFSAVVPLGPDRPHLRTQRPAAPADTSVQPSWDTLWETLCQWSIMAYDLYLDEADDGGPTASTSTATPSTDLGARFQWSALVTLQQLSGAIEPSAVTPDGRSVAIVDSLVVGKTDRPSRVELATVDGLARLAILLRRTASALLPMAPRPKRKVLVDVGISAAPVGASSPAPSAGHHDIDKLVRRVQALEETVRMRSLAEAPPPRPGSTPAVTVHLTSSAWRIGLAFCLGAPVVLAIAVLALS